MRVELSSWQLSLFAAIFVIVANNASLFTVINEKTDFGSMQGVGVFATLVLLLTGVMWFTFLIVGAGKLLKPIVGIVLILSSALGYFTNKMGTVFDPEMIRNIIETVRDANAAEAKELLSWSLLLQVFFLGALPAAFVMSVKLADRTLLRELLTRALCLATGLAVIVPMCILNYQGVTFFGIENRDLRYQLTPIYPLLSLKSYFDISTDDEGQEFRVIGADAMQDKTGRGRIVGVMVVGETARADHFSLNGYGRETNPSLSLEPDLQFFDAASCGTSTAYSVPCMFSLRGRNGYKPDLAPHESNVLDVLQHAGVSVVWLDINSSCKGVCTRINNIDLRQNPDRSLTLPNQGSYFDEALLPFLDQYIDDQAADVLVVLHTMGSHGPAYSRRYPSKFGVFKPFCTNKAPQQCSDSELINAYDNTIFYTDHVLGLIVDGLQQRGSEFESFMFYASDHGESLGENGVYLHGLPYAIAPKAQTRVPIIVWLSQKLSATKKLTGGDKTTLSHDNISHTLLGLFDVSTVIYQNRLDIFSAT